MLKRIARLFVLGVFAMRLRKHDDDELTPDELADLKASLGDSLRTDGSIDFDRLKETSRPLDIDAMRSKDKRVESPLASTHNA